MFEGEGTAAAADELAARLGALRQAIDLLELEFSTTAAAFAATDAYDRAGSVSAFDWIRHNCKVSGHVTYDRLRVGEQMEKLPTAYLALAEGSIGFAHVSLIAGVAKAVQESPTSKHFDEDRLLGLAAQEREQVPLHLRARPPRRRPRRTGFRAVQGRRGAEAGAAALRGWPLQPPPRARPGRSGRAADGARTSGQAQWALRRQAPRAAVGGRPDRARPARPQGQSHGHNFTGDPAQCGGRLLGRGRVLDSLLDQDRRAARLRLHADPCPALARVGGHRRG